MDGSDFEHFWIDGCWLLVLAREVVVQIVRDSFAPQDPKYLGASGPFSFLRSWSPIGNAMYRTGMGDSP